MNFISNIRTLAFIILSTCVASTLSAVQKIDVSGDTVVCFAKQQNPLSKFIKPLFDQVAQQYKLYGINFIYVDITPDASSYQQTYQIFTVPTVVYFKNGFAIYKQDSKKGPIDVATMKKHVERIYFV